MRGIEVRVDHRSLQELGIDRTPTSHLVPSVSAMERRGIATEVGERIALEMATQRLVQAVELGRMMRESSFSGRFWICPGICSGPIRSALGPKVRRPNFHRRGPKRPRQGTRDRRGLNPVKELTEWMTMFER